MIRQAKFKERIWYEPSRIERMLEKEISKYGSRLSEAKIKYTSDSSREELDRTTGKLNGKKDSYDEISIIQSQLDEGVAAKEIFFNLATDPRLYLVRKSNSRNRSSIVYTREFGRSENGRRGLLHIYNVGQGRRGESERYLLDMKEAVRRLNDPSRHLECIVFNKDEGNVQIRSIPKRKYSVRSDPNLEAGQVLLADALNNYYGTSLQPGLFLSWYDKNSPEGREWREKEKEEGKEKKETEAQTKLLESIFSQFSVANLQEVLTSVEPSERMTSSSSSVESLVKIMVPYIIKSGSQAEY